MSKPKRKKDGNDEEGESAMALKVPKRNHESHTKSEKEDNKPIPSVPVTSVSEDSRGTSVSEDSKNIASKYEDQPGIIVNRDVPVTPFIDHKNTNNHDHDDNDDSPDWITLTKGDSDVDDAYHRLKKDHFAKDKGNDTEQDHKVHIISDDNMSLVKKDAEKSLLSKERPSGDHVTLDETQQSIVDTILTGVNVVLVGAGGCGKTVIVREALKVLTLEEQIRDDHGNKSFIYVTAMTGAAGSLIPGAITLHGWMGLGIIGKDEEYNVERDHIRICRRHDVLERWSKTNTLFIDEFSMLTSGLFKHLDSVARRVRRKRHLPFGGMQVILVGDPAQNPPIPEKNSGNQQDFCFTAIKTFSECFDARNIYFLNKIHRQNNPELVQALTEIRLAVNSPAQLKQFPCGKVISEQTIKLFQSRVGVKLDTSDGIQPTHLHSRRFAVDAENRSQFRKLDTPVEKFLADDFISDEADMKDLDKLCNAPSELPLRVGAQVMLLKNLDVPAGLCNGSRGVVIMFIRSPHIDYDRISLKKRKQWTNNNNADLDEMHENKTTKSVPDKNKHEEEETTTEEENTQTKRPLDPSSGYLACTELSTDGPPHNKVNKLCNWPLVRFVNGLERVIVPFEYKWEKWNEKKTRKIKVASRLQLPLCLAWSITIHKAQGMTIDKLRTSIDESIFSFGSAYTALSRIRSLDGLTLDEFSPQYAKVAPVVLWWMNNVLQKQSKSKDTKSVSASS